MRRVHEKYFARLPLIDIFAAQILIEMKKSLLALIFAAAALLAGCGKNGTPGTPGLECGEYTCICNMVPCLGCASEDGGALYFSVLQGDNLVLVKQDKITGDRLVLDTIGRPSDSKTDFSFQFIMVNGDYVYYMPFDVSDSDNRTYKIWRVRKDGSDKMLVSAPEDVLYEYYILGGNIYYRYLFSSNGVWSCGPDGSGAEHLLDKEMNYPILYDGRYYYTSYADYPKLKLLSCLEDGSDERVLVECDGNICFAIGDNGKVYVAMGGGDGWEILSINADGSSLETLVQGLPSVSFINSLDGDVFFSCYNGNAAHTAGLYRLADDSLKCLVSGKVLNFSLLDGGRIIYMNGDDPSSGRLGAPYLTDIDGSLNEKL